MRDRSLGVDDATDDAREAGFRIREAATPEDARLRNEASNNFSDESR